MVRIGEERPSYFSASTPPRVSKKGVDNETRRALMGLSLAQADTPSQNFSAEDRIF